MNQSFNEENEESNKEKEIKETSDPKRIKISKLKVKLYVKVNISTTTH